MNFFRFMLFACGAAFIIGGMMAPKPDDKPVLFVLGVFLVLLGYGLHRFMTRDSRDKPLAAQHRPAPQPMPVPPPPAAPAAKPAKPSAPPTYGIQGYRWRVGFFFLHSLIHFVLSGFKGFLFATALVGVWLLLQVSEEYLKDGLLAFSFLAVASAGLVALPWLLLRWFLWPISEPEWPARPVPAPQPEVPVNPAPTAPQAPVTAPAPPTLQKPAETMVSASPAPPPSSSSKDPKTPDLQRWTDRT